MQNFIEHLLGTLSVSDYAAGMTFALIGALLSLRLHARNRDKFSGNTPYKFSWKFLLHDNAQRLFTGFLVSFIAFRFAPEIMNTDFSMFLAFLVGFLNDQVAGLISKLELKARGKSWKH